MVVLLYVKNSFNNVPCSAVMEELEWREISLYIRALVNDYLNNRRVKATSEGGVGCDFYIHGEGGAAGLGIGTPPMEYCFQRSTQARVPGDTEVVAYADDLVLLVSGASEGEVEDTANTAITKVSRWLNAKGLRLAPEKTSVLVMAGRRRLRKITLVVDGVRMWQVGVA